MKKWLIALFLLSGTVIFILFSLEDPGFIVIGRGSWTVETSLSAFFIALILAWLIIRLLEILWHLPLRLFYNHSIRQKKSQESLIRGLLTLIQGEWKKSEQIFLKNISLGTLSSLHYFGAAYAAYQQKSPSRATDYIKKLNCPAMPIALFEAKLQLQQQNLPTALEKAEIAHSLAPKNDEILSILIKLYVQLAEWQALLTLLPKMRKSKILSAEQRQHLENRANIALIHHTLRKNPTQAAKIWSQIPKVTRLRPDLVKIYVEHLISSGDATIAEPLLREALKYQWDVDLLSLYGKVETTNTRQQINYAESWLKHHDSDLVLLQTLGHLCLRNRLWDKAQEYLEKSAKLAHSPQTYKLLGDLSVKKGKQLQAIDYYQRGLIGDNQA